MIRTLTFQKHSDLFFPLAFKNQHRENRSAYKVTCVLLLSFTAEISMCAALGGEMADTIGHFKFLSTNDKLICPAVQ